jgi:hypothetical protein
VGDGLLVVLVGDGLLVVVGDGDGDVVLHHLDECQRQVADVGATVPVDVPTSVITSPTRAAEIRTPAGRRRGRRDTCFIAGGALLEGRVEWRRAERSAARSSSGPADERFRGSSGYDALRTPSQRRAQRGGGGCEPSGMTPRSAAARAHEHRAGHTTPLERRRTMDEPSGLPAGFEFIRPSQVDDSAQGGLPVIAVTTR